MDGNPTAAIRRVEDDLLVDVRLTPKGGRDRIDGVGVLSDGRPVILARVRTPPEDGKANAALIVLIAAAAGLPKSAASLASGATSRLKTVRLENADTDAERRLRDAVGSR